MARLAKKRKNKTKHGLDLGLALWLLVKSKIEALGALRKADAGIEQQRLNSALGLVKRKLHFTEIKT